MQIDWITVSAQIVNFLILVWLLKQFLYQPVMRAMERRERRISGRLEDAQKREKEAQEQISKYQEKTEQLEKEHEEILQQAREEAEAEKHRMLDEARDEVDIQRKHWQQQLDQEQTEFLKKLRQQASDTIMVIARKALADLANAKLEAQMIEAFLDRLGALDKQEVDSMTKGNDDARIESSFRIESTERARITRYIHEKLSDKIDVDYSETSQLSCGIELIVGERRLSWNLDSYLEQLDHRIKKTISEEIPTK